MLGLGSSPTHRRWLWRRERLVPCLDRVCQNLAPPFGPQMWPKDPNLGGQIRAKENWHTPFLWTGLKGSNWAKTVCGSHLAAFSTLPFGQNPIRTPRVLPPPDACLGAAAATDSTPLPGVSRPRQVRAERRPSSSTVAPSSLTRPPPFSPSATFSPCAADCSAPSIRTAPPSSIPFQATPRT